MGKSTGLETPKKLVMPIVHNSSLPKAKSHMQKGISAENDVYNNLTSSKQISFIKDQMEQMKRRQTQ